MTTQQTRFLRLTSSSFRKFSLQGNWLKNGSNQLLKLTFLSILLLLLFIYLIFSKWFFIDLPKRSWMTTPSLEEICMSVMPQNMRLPKKHATSWMTDEGSLLQKFYNMVCHLVKGIHFCLEKFYHGVTTWAWGVRWYNYTVVWMYKLWRFPMSVLFKVTSSWKCSSYSYVALNELL